MIRQIIIKGGPGSGHFGHAGNPPNVGGSVKGSLRTSGAINPNFFMSSTWLKLTADLSAPNRNDLAGNFIVSGVSSNHLYGLTEITSEHHSEWIPIGYELPPENWDNVGAKGYYHLYDKSIHIDPDTDYLSAVFFHEVGHHVHSMMSSDRRVLMEDFYNDLTSELQEDYPHFNMGQLSLPEGLVADLAIQGLRRYSIQNPGELTADLYGLSTFAKTNRTFLPTAIGNVSIQTHFVNERLQRLSDGKYTLENLFEVETR
jgi:hypothetical protein